MIRVPPLPPQCLGATMCKLCGRELAVAFLTLTTPGEGGRTRWPIGPECLAMAESEVSRARRTTAA